MKEMKQIFLLILGFILITFTIVFLFTRTALIPQFDFSKTGQIGDTIGGITSPIIGIIGAVLVYLSFKQQYDANVIQREALSKEVEKYFITREFEQIERILNSVKRDVENLSIVSIRRTNLKNISTKIGDATYEQFMSNGIISISEFIFMFNSRYLTIQKKELFLRQINFILYQIKYAERKTINLKLKKIDIEYLSSIIKLYYRVILEPNVIALQSLLKKQSLPIELKEEFNKLNELIAYLNGLFNSTE